MVPRVSPTTREQQNYGDGEGHAAQEREDHEPRPSKSAHAPLAEQVGKHPYQNQGLHDERGGDGIGQGSLEEIRLEQQAVGERPVNADQAEDAQRPKPESLLPTVRYLNSHVTPPPPPNDQD